MKAAEYNFIVGVIPKEGHTCPMNRFFFNTIGSFDKKDWRGPTCQSFFGYDNDKELKACYRVTLLMMFVMVPVVGKSFLGDISIITSGFQLLLRDAIHGFLKDMMRFLFPDCESRKL